MDCDDCETQIENNKEVYCIKCGKILCENCRLDYFCTDCWREETADGDEKDLMARLKPVLAPLQRVLRYPEYKQVIKIIQAWRDKKNNVANSICVMMSCILTCKTMAVIYKMESVVDGTIKYLDVHDIPNFPYKQVHGGNFLIR